MRLIDKDKLLKKCVHNVFNPYTDTTDDYIWADDVESFREVSVKELAEYLYEHKGMMIEIITYYKDREQERIKKLLEDSENV